MSAGEHPALGSLQEPRRQLLGLREAPLSVVGKGPVCPQRLPLTLQDRTLTQSKYLYSRYDLFALTFYYPFLYLAAAAFF